MSTEQVRVSADGSERVTVRRPWWATLPVVVGVKGNIIGQFAEETIERSWPVIILPATRPTAIDAGAACVTDLPRGAEVRGTLDDGQRVVVEGPSGRVTADTMFHVRRPDDINWPSYRAEQVLCRWPRIVTTPAEALALRALRETSWSGDYTNEFKLRDAILAGLPTFAAACTAVRAALDKHDPRAWGWLEEDLRVALEACGCGGCMPGEHPVGHPAHEEPNIQNHGTHRAAPPPQALEVRVGQTREPANDTIRAIYGAWARIVAHDPADPNGRVWSYEDAHGQGGKCTEETVRHYWPHVITEPVGDGTLDDNDPPVSERPFWPAVFRSVSLEEARAAVDGLAENDPTTADVLTHVVAELEHLRTRRDGLQASGTALLTRARAAERAVADGASLRATIREMAAHLDETDRLLSEALDALALQGHELAARKRDLAPILTLAKTQRHRWHDGENVIRYILRRLARG